MRCLSSASSVFAASRSVVRVVTFVLKSALAVVSEAR